MSIFKATICTGYFMVTENLEDVFNYTIIGQKISFLEMLKIIIEQQCFVASHSRKKYCR